MAWFVVVALVSLVVLGLVLSASFFMTSIQSTLGVYIQAFSAAATGDPSPVYYSNLSIRICVWVSSGVPWLTRLLV